MTVTHYLDCGCALTTEGRTWCPTCLDGGPRVAPVAWRYRGREGGAWRLTDEPPGPIELEHFEVQSLAALTARKEG